AGEALVVEHELAPDLGPAAGRLELDVEPGAEPPREGGDLGKGRDLRHALAQRGGGQPGDAGVDAEDALEMVVVADDDHTVARELGVELPHLGAEAGGEFESCERVLGRLPARAAMADAERKAGESCRPAETRDEGREIARHSRRPSSAKTMILSRATAQRTSSPTLTSLCTDWIERSTLPSGSATS